MRRYLLLLCVLLMTGVAQGQQQDSLLFCLKVKAAEKRGLDTLPSFRMQCDSLRRILSVDYLVDKTVVEEKVQAMYDARKKAYGEEVHVLQLFNYLPQNVSVLKLRSVEQLMDSLYQCLMKGRADFDTLVQDYSDEKQSRWIAPLQKSVEWENKVAALKVGEFTAPFYTPEGIYMVKLLGKRTCPDLKDVREKLLPYAYRAGALALAEKLKEAYCFQPNRPGIDELMRSSRTDQELFRIGTVSYSGADFAHFAMAYPTALKEQWEMFQLKCVLDYENGVLEEKYPKFKQQLQAFRDERLVELITYEEIIKPTDTINIALENYFKAHRSSYYWDAPRFKGVVAHCANKTVAKQLRKLLKRTPREEWKTVLEDFSVAHGENVVCEMAVFAQGDNPFVDRKIYKGKQVSSLSTHPFTVVSGKKIKGPEMLDEAGQKVLVDYRKLLLKQWESDLLSTFKTEIGK